MKSIRSIYKIGNGPSSSHTVGPYNAAVLFSDRYREADHFEVILYGSLAFTGEGHGTERAIKNVIKDCEVSFDRETTDLPHPNTMLFKAYKDGELIGENRILSIGGVSIIVEGEESIEEKEIYPQKNFTEIIEECKKKDISLLEFIYQHEGEGLKEYLSEVWKAMKETIERGLVTEGILPGGLEITRKAKTLLETRCYREDPDTTMNRKIAAYAYAVSEENASENIVVTAPTCGAAGVIPSILYYAQKDCGYLEEEIINALAIAAIIGNVIRTNASISGAECGCQAEIGSACSMAAGGLAYLYGLSLDEIEYAAEVAMEHNLGLTCDPVKGLVQIPCIERNAVAAMRAFSSVTLARLLYQTRKISFDEVVATMYQTGKDMSEKYRETSHGGLAQIYKTRNK
ncbi:MAG: L-serine ammonia-lyase, iron-sulfur-dependent, subunit alpha [Erysipelotrichaceae bacterium]|nr:L-serine ammonia-lyase, iron-sulfur-dependent, subunit alpha [Erysipelotrichaceae bacterium]